MPTDHSLQMSSSAKPCLALNPKPSINYRGAIVLSLSDTCLTLQEVYCHTLHDPAVVSEVGRLRADISMLRGILPAGEARVHLPVNISRLIMQAQNLFGRDTTGTPCVPYG